jgi:hypothetical protein
VLLNYDTLDWVEKLLLASQYLSNGKSSNAWHNYQASLLLSLTTELLMSQERALTKDVIKRRKNWSRGFTLWAYSELELSVLEELQRLVLLLTLLASWEYQQPATSPTFSFIGSRLGMTERSAFYKHFAFKRYCKRKMEQNNGHFSPEYR